MCEITYRTHFQDHRQQREIKLWILLQINLFIKGIGKSRLMKQPETYSITWRRCLHQLIDILCLVNAFRPKWVSKWNREIVQFAITIQRNYSPWPADICSSSSTANQTNSSRILSFSSTSIFLLLLLLRLDTSPKAEDNCVAAAATATADLRESPSVKWRYVWAVLPSNHLV